MKGLPAMTRQLSASNPLWLVLGIAFLLRILLPLVVMTMHRDASVFSTPDTMTYVAPAQSLLTSGGLNKDGHPEIWHPPGYPLFLMPGLLAGHLLTVTISLQIIISTATAFFLYLISKRLFSRAVAYCCAGLYAIEPLSVIYCSKILSETLFTFLVVLFLYQTVCYMQQGKLLTLLIGTVSLAAATYVRPVSYYLPIVLVPVIFYISSRMQRLSTAVTHTTAFFLLIFALVGAWQVRNYRLSGYGGFSATADWNLYFNQGASIIAKKTGRSYYTVENDLGYLSPAEYVRSHPNQQSWSDAEKYAYMHQEGLQLIRHNLLTYTLIHLKGMVMVLGEPEGFEYSKLFKKYPSSGGLLGGVVDAGILPALNAVRTQYPFSFYTTMFLAALLIFYLVLAVSGIALAWSHAQYAVVLLVTVAAYFAVLSGGPLSATGRMRHPIMPIVCLFAGYALAVGLTRVFTRKFAAIEPLPATD